jgi:hypothetical protein
MANETVGEIDLMKPLTLLAFPAASHLFVRDGAPNVKPLGLSYS